MCVKLGAWNRRINVDRPLLWFVESEDLAVYESSVRLPFVGGLEQLYVLFEASEPWRWAKDNKWIEILNMIPWYFVHINKYYTS